MTDRATAVFEMPPSGEAALRCAACATRACEALGNVPGVGKVDCDAKGSTVNVEFDPSRVSEADLVVEMHRFGLELEETYRHAAWRVSGLD